jgi:hypothetical protein
VRGARPLSRNIDLHQDLTVLVVCGVATVVLTRGFLAATGYPQVGGSKLHIAHVLWGGLLMLLALIAVVSFLNPGVRLLASLVGGVGFGLFIDEVGKFVTKDVNYFYKPAIAIIYVAFIALFALIRWLSKRGYDGREATLNALEGLMRSAVGRLDGPERARVIALLDSTGVDDPLARGVRALLAAAAVDPEQRPFARRVSDELGRVWRELTAHRLFRTGLFAALIVAAAVSAAETAWLLRHGFSRLSLGQAMFAGTNVVADLMLVAGAFALSRSLLAALHWYDHAVLIEITVGQVFLFGSEQLEASLDLVALLIVFAVLRWAIGYESLNPSSVASTSVGSVRRL